MPIDDKFSPPAPEQPRQHADQQERHAGWVLDENCIIALGKPEDVQKLDNLVYDAEEGVESEEQEATLGDTGEAAEGVDAGDADVAGVDSWLLEDLVREGRPLVPDQIHFPVCSKRLTRRECMIQHPR